jgi:HAD superfamily 5'-nucleotidase-like hydrolase
MSAIPQRDGPDTALGKERMNRRGGEPHDEHDGGGLTAQGIRAGDRSSTTGLPPLHRRVFCNRTLNLRTIRAVGCDMDYTLIHYHTEKWEGRAYEHVRARLAQEGWPVQHLVFDQKLVARGLIVDQELGNVLKADRFGFVRRACHGTRMLEFDEQRRVYGGLIVDLHDARWTFMNTFFSLSEACLFLQLVDLHDARQIEGVSGYAEILRRIRLHLDATHMEGQLKEEIIRAPERLVDLGPRRIDCAACQASRGAAERPLGLIDEGGERQEPLGEAD